MLASGAGKGEQRRFYDTRETRRRRDFHFSSSFVAEIRHKMERKSASIRAFSASPQTSDSKEEK